MRRALSAFFALVFLSGCALLTPLPRKSDLRDRLAQFPATGLPIEQPIAVYWDDHQIPFIEAASDRDAAFALGLVHAHLRLGQMELLRRISQGRIAEVGGPLAADIDHSLRILDFGKAAPAIVASMPADSRAWLDAFVAGINHYQATAAKLPHEYALLGLEREPWRPEEIVAIGRLASTDVTWLVWFRLLGLRDEPGWPQLWQRIAAAGVASTPSFTSTAAADLGKLEALLNATNKSGSNCVAVGGARSASGGALLACDPHLGLSLPNLWLIVGVKSPSYNMVGLMVPGLPFAAVGRNQSIAWGGTNLRAASSDLFDVRDLPPEQIATRTERIRVRWWFDREVEVRDTPYGPLVSDAPLLPVGANDRLALRWIGHRPTDEITALLAVNRARNWDEFRAALAGFALSPQNFLYADSAGNIGQVTAAHLPRRPNLPPADIVRPLADAAAWDSIATSAELPAAYNPPAGFLASANNRPADADILLGYFFSADDRVLRLQERLAAQPRWNVDDLRRLQLDTHRRSALQLRDLLMPHLAAMGGTTEPAWRTAIDLIAAWDGDYKAESRGPVAFEALTAGFVEALYDPDTRAAYDAGDLYEFLIADLPSMEPDRVAGALRAALPIAADAVARYASWGDMHRMPVQHMLGVVPVLGARYRFGDRPASGSSETILKTAHDLTAGRHMARYGTQARHISDLADPDANWFVLYGGQDGWFNSSSFADQVDAFMAGELIRVPLRPETVRASFPHRLTLTP